MIKKISVKTLQKEEVIDLTIDIQNILNEVDFKEGVVTLFAKHTTCSLFMPENEVDLNSDLFKFLKGIVPGHSFSHSHSHNLNGDIPHSMSHVISSIIGQTLTIPVESGMLSLGTWQKICLLELDGPKKRDITLSLIH